MKKILSLSMLIASMFLIPLSVDAARGGRGSGGRGGSRSGFSGTRVSGVRGSGFSGTRISSPGFTGTRVGTTRGITGTRIGTRGITGTRIAGIRGGRTFVGKRGRGFDGRGGGMFADRGFRGHGIHGWNRNHWGWGNWGWGLAWPLSGLWWNYYWGPDYLDNYPYLYDIDYDYGPTYWTVVNDSSYNIVAGTYDGRIRGRVRMDETVKIPGDTYIVIGRENGKAHVFSADPGQIINVTDDMLVD